VVAGLLPRHPARLRLRAGDAGHDLLPGGGGPAGVEHPDAGGVGEEVAESDPLLAVNGELREMPGDRVVEIQEPALPALPKLRHGHRRHRLGRG